MRIPIMAKVFACSMMSQLPCAQCSPENRARRLVIIDCDVHQGNGRLSLSTYGLGERDRLVIELCRSSSIPVVVVMGGGYGCQVEDSVVIQYQTVYLAAEFAA